MQKAAAAATGQVNKQQAKQVLQEMLLHQCAGKSSPLQYSIFWLLSWYPLE